MSSLSAAVPPAGPAPVAQRWKKAIVGAVVVLMAAAGLAAIVAVTSLATPTGLTGTPGDKQATLKWNPVTNATKYSVWRQSSLTATRYRIAQVTVPSYTDVGLTNGNTYYYSVNAATSSKASPISDRARIGAHVSRP